MNMLADFFDIQKDSRNLFEGLAISDNPELCDQWMNQYPVLFLSFKNIDGFSFQSAYDLLANYYDQMIEIVSVMFSTALKDNPNLQFAVITGCLQITKEKSYLHISNKEIMEIFRKSVVEWFDDKSIHRDRSLLFQSFWTGEVQKLTGLLSDLLFETISYHDYAESCCHAFLTELLVIKDRKNQLVNKCMDALQQIKNRKYAIAIEKEGYKKCFDMGLLFARSVVRSFVKKLSKGIG